MIKKAELEDVRKIVDLLCEFHSQAGQPQDFIDDDAHKFVRFMIFSPSAIMLVSDNGMICGLLVQCPINSEWLMALELYWYAKDGNGALLMNAFEKASIDMGAHEIRITHRDPTPKIGRFLRLIGYNPSEVSHARII